ncbi:hypothetical protein ZIOFF_040005 [Zingiber officinale]|uniref:F-box/LRR-repeat protein 15-like leucin rich repeat domain-containing protein n=1 Tax=Zingiber officinale TaxID=94328 RepID=A0A8J5G5G9_ZINOF|nr:hypothetical protein ZIOFF_040005 [Zingiber officinale]
MVLTIPARYVTRSQLAREGSGIPHLCRVHCCRLPSPPYLEMLDEGGTALHHGEKGADHPAPPAPALEHCLPSAPQPSLLPSSPASTPAPYAPPPLPATPFVPPPLTHCLTLSSLAERRGLSFVFADLEALLTGCSQLSLWHLIVPHSTILILAKVWANASEVLSCLEIGYIPATMLMELLNETVNSLHHSNCRYFPAFRCCLSVDYITDHLVGFITKGFPLLSSLDLQEAPIMEPILTTDLTNTGLQQINSHGKLKHISLILSQVFMFTYFRRVNDVGFLLMSDGCSTMESICLGGFCCVTDTGFRVIIHSYPNLRKFRVSHGSQLTDLVFHDISATFLLLMHVSLRWFNLLSNNGVVGLPDNKQLMVLDLRDCRNLGDEAVKALSYLPKLQVLLLDGSDTTDKGLFYQGNGSLFTAFIVS